MINEFFSLMVRLHDLRIGFSPLSSVITKSLQKNGYYFINNFLTTNEIDLINSEIKKVDKSYFQYFENDKRLFGAQYFSSYVNDLFSSPILNLYASSYLGTEIVNQTSLYANIRYNKESQHGSGGDWHRDSYTPQFKALIYLSDVSEDNGPFMYLKASHTYSSFTKVNNYLKRKTSQFNPKNCRYDSSTIEEMIRELDFPKKVFTGLKGSLILADTRGIHTGMPLKSGSRKALFNYYIPKKAFSGKSSIDISDKLSNTKKSLGS